MAPHSAVLRRSHGKSKDGCKTCLSRRVRCDQARPTCQNCARGSRACVYLSSSTRALSDHAKSIAWVDSIEIACQTWRESGDTPFPMLKVLSSLDWHGLDPRGLRYLYYIASLGDILDQNNARQFALWWDVYEVGIQATAKYDFVAYAQIVAAATRIGKLTRMASVMEDAVRYRSLALKGLQQALASFSKENADGVLAASISFMFNQPTAADLRRIMQGTVAVVEAMRPWAATSGARPLLELIYPVGQNTHSPTIQNGGGPCSPEPTTISAPLVLVQSAAAAVEFLLEQGLTALNRLATCIRQMRELSTTVRGLADMLRMAQAKHLNGQKYDPFWLIHPFGGLTSRESISFTDIHSSKPFVLVFLAHLYSALVVLSMLYPELDTAGFVTIRLHSLDALTRHFEPIAAIDCETCRDAHSCQELLAFPWNALQACRKWRMDRQTISLPAHEEWNESPLSIQSDARNLCSNEYALGTQVAMRGLQNAHQGYLLEYGDLSKHAPRQNPAAQPNELDSRDYRDHRTSRNGP